MVYILVVKTVAYFEGQKAHNNPETKKAKGNKEPNHTPDCYLCIRKGISQNHDNRWQTLRWEATTDICES